MTCSKNEKLTSSAAAAAPPAGVGAGNHRPSLDQHSDNVASAVDVLPPSLPVRQILRAFGCAEAGRCGCTGVHVRMSLLR